MTLNVIPIVAAEPDLCCTAAQWATVYHLPLIDTVPKTDTLFLYLTSERLELRTGLARQSLVVYVDFVTGQLNYRHHFGGGRRQPLARAVGMKAGFQPTVLDATAGLGRDAFILAGLGCHVSMLERSAVVAALLADGLRRAQWASEIGTWVTERLHLIHRDARPYLESLPLDYYPEVIYLDPMYPPRQKSALVKKEMQILQRLLGQETDAHELLAIALRYAQKRVVVKRPSYGHYLADNTPTFSICSEKTRFDVYLMNSN